MHQRQSTELSTGSLDPLGLSRRQFFTRLGAWSIAAGAASIAPGSRAAAQTPEASPVAGDLAGLLALSQALCGGGTFDDARGAMLLDALSADPELHAGLETLLAQSPLDPAESREASAAATAILLFWYAGVSNGEPVSDRATAFYSLTAWQAMYTFPSAVCRGFGVWSDPPQTDPVVPANS